MINKDKLIKRLNDFTPEELADFLYNVAPCEFCISDVPACELCRPNCGDKCIKYIKEWLEKEVEPEQTADEMFKKLGYDKLIDNEVITLYVEDHEDENEIIQIYKQLNEPMYCKYAESKSEDIKTHEAMRITVAENKAINKKLEELKNGY